MPAFDALQVLDHLLHLLLAYGLALPIAWDREAHSRGVGLITFMTFRYGTPLKRVARR